MDREPPRALLVSLGVVLVTGAGLAFSPALDAAFVSWDDGLTVTDNYRIRELSPRSLGWMFSTSWAGHYQPLSWLTLALDFQRAGLDPRPYHATNLALHALGAVVLFALALRVFGLGVRRGGKAWSGTQLALAAALAAAIHAFHPLRCESVCWVTERRDVLSAPFFFLAIWSYLDARRTAALDAVDFRRLGLGASAGGLALASLAGSVSLSDPRALAVTSPIGLALGVGLWLASAGLVAHGVSPAGARWRLPLLFMALSLGAKAWALVLPAVFLCLDVWPLGRLGERGGRLARALALVLEKAPALALALVFARLAQWAQVAQQGTVDVWSVHSFGERVVQALYGLAFYPAKTLWPVGLAPLYPLPQSVSLLDPRFGLAALATLAALAGALACARRAPAVGMGLAIYGVIVSPVLGFQQSGPQLVADRYATLAGFPLACLVAAAVLVVARRHALASRFAVALCSLGLVWLIALSLVQSRVWTTSERLWTHAVAANPGAAIGWLNLGLARADRARTLDDPAARALLYDAAVTSVVEARRLRPQQPLFRMNEAILRVARASAGGTSVPREELDAALALAREAIEQAEADGLRDGTWYWHHGRLLLRAGALVPALERFEAALALRPHWPAATHALGASLLDRAVEEGSPEAALRRVERALEILAAPSAPRDAEASLLRAGAEDLRWQLLRRLERPESDVAEARRRALAGWRAVPLEHPRADAARARAAAIEATP